MIEPLELHSIVQAQAVLRVLSAEVGVQWARCQAPACEDGTLACTTGKPWDECLCVTCSRSDKRCGRCQGAGFQPREISTLRG